MSSASAPPPTSLMSQALAAVVGGASPPNAAGGIATKAEAYAATFARVHELYVRRGLTPDAGLEGVSFLDPLVRVVRPGEALDDTTCLRQFAGRLRRSHP